MKSIKQLLAEFSNTSEQQPDIPPSGVRHTRFLIPQVAQVGEDDPELHSILKALAAKLPPDIQEKVKQVVAQREQVNPERPASAKYDYGEPGHIIGQPPPTTRFTRFGDK